MLNAVKHPPRWRGFLATLGMTTALMALAGCGGSPATAPGSAPAASGAWQDILAAAKREAQVTIISQSGNDVGTGLTEAFGKAYPEIRVELLAGNGADMSNKLLTERAANRFTTD